MNTNKNLAVVAIVVALLAAACVRSDEIADLHINDVATTSAPADSEQPDVGSIADDIDAVGDPDAEIVIVNTQGGPTTALEPAALVADLLVGDAVDDVYVVNVHQAQTADPDRFVTADVSFEDAKDADAESVATLARVVRHFVEEGRQVYVVGISFGAFVLADLLVEQGPIATGYLAAVGRLDMPAAVWTEFSEGRAAGFVDGVDIVQFEIEDAGMGAGTDAGDRNMARLAAGLGHKRYTELLDGVDLSTLVYVHGSADEQVGRLTDAEVGFLEAGGATVIGYEGGHDTPDDVLADAIAALPGSDADATAVGEESAAFEVVGSAAVMRGVIDSATPSALKQLLADHPEVDRLVLQDVPGSIDDVANLEAARLVREAELATHVPADGVIASGGVDFYLAGASRSFDAGAQFGVHSWGTGDASVVAAELPRADDAHRLYLDYYAEIGVAADFYWFTLDAAPAEDIHWMTPAELARYEFAT